MGEISALATAALTVSFVWLISCFVSKLDSLPVDFGVAGLSLIFLFVDLADREMHEGQNFAGRNPIWLIVLVLAIYVFVLALTTAVFLLRSKPPQILEQYKISATIFQEFGYWFSLGLSFFMLLMAVSAASSANSLLAINLNARGSVSVLYHHLTSQLGGFTFVFIMILLGLTAIIRYVIFPSNPKPQ